MKLLLIEDDPRIYKILLKGLSEKKIDVEFFSNGLDGLTVALQGRHDLIIVDIMLPGLDGIQLIKEMRSQNVHTPVIVLSSKETAEDRVLALQSGADDYISKPFSFVELLLRINLRLKKSNPAAVAYRDLQFADITMNIEKKEVFRGQRKLNLHVKEYQLLEYFLQNPEVVLNKSQILERVWGYNFDPQTNVVDVLVCRLRNKVDKDSPEKLIQTIRGMGYALRRN